ncbi:hypothetical protein SAMN05920897_11393 [Alkalispirochaeta americana]|uniref:Lipoprotein n=1 Tax=Alkalispirochaeta americana TaxID=159291 RepID=A0A1N6V1D4_9SPIO|nr:hypothetical protein [Alkalispirochaeta americana]SIQ71703.1 hypothetical protein SAMN05920897_11393 [Alkalispirochaeta americana]
MVCAGFLAVLAVSGCSSADPEIMQMEISIVASCPDVRGSVEERLMVFADIHDPDGPEDVAWMVVEFPDQGFGWELSGQDLEHHHRDDRHWFGSPGLVFPGTATLPRGPLRVTVGDYSGRTVEMEQILPRPPGVSGCGTFPRLKTDSASEAGFSLVPASGGGRHFVRTDRGVLEFQGDLSGPAPLGADFRDFVGDQEFFLLAQAGPALWLESGPWHSDRGLDD